MVLRDNNVVYCSEVLDKPLPLVLRFLTGKMGVSQGLIQGIMRPCFLSSSIMDFMP